MVSICLNQFKGKRLSILLTVACLFCFEIAFANKCVDLFQPYNIKNASLNRQNSAKDSLKRFISLFKITKPAEEKFYLPKKLDGLVEMNLGSTHTNKKGAFHGYGFTKERKSKKINILKSPPTRDFVDLSKNYYKINVGEAKYTLTNIGNSLFFKDVKIINNFFSNLYKNINAGSYIFPMTKQFQLHERLVSSWQSFTSYLVIKNYKKRKPYLSEADLREIWSHDLMENENSEYWVLNKGDVSPFEQKPNEYEDNLDSVIRLARYKRFNPDNVYRIGWGNRLPFFSRLDHASEQAFADALSLLYENGYELAEISRFNRFKEVPSEVMEYMVYNILNNQRRDKPVDVFFIEVDDITRKLFAKYNFSELAKISKTDAAISEYVMYLKVDSPEYKKTMEYLEKKISGLAIEKPKLRFSTNKKDNFWSEVMKVMFSKSGSIIF